MAKNKTIASLSLLTLGFPLLCAAKISSQTPSQTSSAVTYQSCASYAADIAAYGNSSTKDTASLYLDGALDQLELDTLPSQKETQKRDACVLLSLQHGADANNKKVYSAPLLMAIADKDLTAVQLLLQYKANPNITDDALVGANKVPALQRACDTGNEDISIALINAGADPSINQALWTASSDAEARVVAAMLKTGKVPVNQLIKFSDEGDDRETALDASESRIDALNQYFTKFANSSASDKLDAANEVLYAEYVIYPMLRTGTDPDAYLKNLLQNQKRVSSLLKSAGWTCHQPNCGIDPLLNDDGTSTDDSAGVVDTGVVAE